LIISREPLQSGKQKPNNSAASLLTFDLKKEAWKTGESPDIELRWRGCEELGLEM
jgi:hypothetical protein